MAVDFAWLRNWFSLGVGNRDRGHQRPDSGSRSNESNVTLTDQRALEAPVVFSCIRLLAELIGTISLGTYRRTAAGRVSAEDHRVAALLREPNPFMTGQQLIEALAAQVCGWGNGYDLVDRNNAGEPVMLWPLLPADMKVHREGFDRLIYKYSTSTGQRDLTQAQVLHVKGFGTDGIVGLSPLGYARQALGIQIAAEKYAAQFYASGGLPSGVMMLDKPLNPQQRKDLAANYGPMVRGEVGGNNLWVLESFAKYQPVSISPEDAQMLLTRQFSVEEIARIFRVPLSLLMHGSKDSNWGTGLEQQNLAFLTYTLRPYLVRIESAINRWLFSPAERKEFYVEFNVESLLRGDSAARSAYYSQALQNGWMNRNEVRSKENQPPFDGGEIFTAQSNMLPVDKLGAEPPKPPAGAPPTKERRAPIVVLHQPEPPPDNTAQTDALEHVAEAVKAVALAEEHIANAMQSGAQDNALGRRALESVSHATRAMTEGLAQVAQAVAKPRKAVIDKDGNPIGTVQADSLE